MSWGDAAQRFRQKAEQEAVKSSQPVVDPAEVMTIRARITGVLIRDARITKGFSTEQLASIMNIEPDLVTAWEFGNASPSLPQIELLAYWLEVPVNHFMSGTETLLKQTVERRLDQNEYLQIRDRMIGALIQEARQERGYTRDYLAQLVGVDATSLANYEYGRESIPLSTLNDLAGALHVTVSYFLEGSDRVGKFIQAQALFRVFLEMEPELRDFVSTPANHAYLELAMKFARMDTRKLREIAEMLLEITL